MPFPKGITRRRFLADACAPLMACAIGRGQTATVDPDLIAILNDAHVGEKQPSDSQRPANLRATLEYISGLPRPPIATVINGDLANFDGQPGDYARLAEIVRPVRKSGLAIHLLMGNHDNRDNFYSIFAEDRPATPAVPGKHVAIVETSNANLFLLDSLKGPGIPQGQFGEAQLAWLAKELDARPSKPAIVFAHHNPRLGGDQRHYTFGLEDSEEAWRILVARKQVKAYVHGHVHSWSVAEHDGIHIVNTPAVSYVAFPTLTTTGWIMARLSPKAIELTVHTHIEDHPWNGEHRRLAWRS